MAEEQAAKKRGKGAGARGKGKGAGDKPSDKKKKKNPLVQEARSQYLKQLRTEGGSDEQMKEKLKSHMKSVVKPALSQAKADAKAKNLKGKEKKSFVQEAVRSKLGLARA